MLSTAFPQFWFFATLFFAGVSLSSLFYFVLHARKLAAYAGECASWIEKHNLDALADSKIAELERSLTELWDSHQSLLASHKRLRSKYGMRDLRERRKNGDDTDNPDLFADDERKAAQKAKLRAQAKRDGLLR